MDLATNNAYPTPFANTTIMPLILMSLAQQKNAPTTSDTFREEYDYIIVGAGSAGSVVAGRLTEIECVSVLLLEAGKSPPLINDVPLLGRNFWFTDLDWTYKTVPQKNTGRVLVDNKVIWPSGKAIGGSSILNAMLYVRGNNGNYDNWARSGAVGWSASDVRPYFLKLENNSEPEYLANGYHVVGGPMSVENPAYHTEIKLPVFEAARGFGYEILDSNGKRQTGFTEVQGTLRRGQRCSTAKAYLVPAENRTNLDILPNAFVRKVLFKNKRAIGVQFEYKGKTQEVRARKEVILSAGTTNTAQLLMLSGIGPKKHLEKLKIPIVADLPVGDNFHDHCGSFLGYELDPSLPSIAKKFSDPTTVTDYIQNRKGLLTSAEGCTLMSFLSNQVLPEKDDPKFQVYFVEIPLDLIKFQFGLQPKVYEKVYAPYENSTTYFCAVSILQPKSRGTVRLNSTNPHDPPLIEPNYLHHPDDVRDMVDGLKVCKKIGASPSMLKLGSKPFLTKMTGCEMFTDDDQYFECLLRSYVYSFSHQVGTAKMGHPSDRSTVVDPRLREGKNRTEQNEELTEQNLDDLSSRLNNKEHTCRPLVVAVRNMDLHNLSSLAAAMLNMTVKSVNGLRVVDASVMPIVPSGNTNIATIMVAEKASDMIKGTINC